MLDDIERGVRSELAAAGSEDEFWARAEQTGTPRVEETSNGLVRVTFLWRALGNAPFRIYVDAGSMTDHHAASLTVMTRLDQTGIWFWSTEVSRTWRGTYCFMPVSSDVVAELDPPGIAETLDGVRSRFLGLLDHAVADPFNPRAFGHGSIAEMPDATAQRWWNDAPPSGRTPRKLNWDSTVLGTTRDVWIHETADAPAASDRPLVIVLDGRQWIEDAPLAPVLDRATTEGELPPAVLLFVDSIDPQTRGRELPCNRDFWDAVVEELIPLASAEATFTRDPMRTVVSGQSYGGLASLFAALEFPERFGLVASQSGSFWWPVMSHGGECGPPGGRIAEILDSLSEPLPIRVVMDVGIHEGDMVPHNRHIAHLLQENEIDVSFSEFDGGHEWLCWRGGLVEALIELLDQACDTSDEAGDDDDHDDSDEHEEDDR